MRTRGLFFLVVVLCLLSGLNAIALIINLSQPSRAAVGGMSYEDLVHDSDFTRAVKSVAQACKVNVDIGKLVC
jgi:hypothetical protein